MSESELQKASHFLKTAECFLGYRSCLRHNFWDPTDVSSDDVNWILSWFFTTQQAWKQLDLSILDNSAMILEVSDMVAKLPKVMFEHNEVLPSIERVVYY
jgi:hypothetical protein